jgi:L-lysine exporter family protein LysE/ArgO
LVGAFVHGFVLALALILPLGPQNTFVLTQGATQPRWRLALPVVLTAAASDTALIVAAVAGVSLVLLAIPALRLVLSAAGVLFLVYMGIKAWTSAGAAEDTAGARAEWTLGRKVRYSLSVSLLNPHAILDTMVIIGGGAAIYANPAERWAYAGAAVAVSWLWFFALSLLGRVLQRAAGGVATGRLLGRASAAIMWTVALRYAVEVVHMAT